MSIGTPVKLLYEGIGHVITAELCNGLLYRGTLTHAEDTMNCLMEGVVVTMRDGKTMALEQVYLRGSQIRFMVFPDMLRHAPMFKLNPKDRPRIAVLPGMKQAIQMRAKNPRGVKRA